MKKKHAIFMPFKPHRDSHHTLILRNLHVTEVKPKMIMLLHLQKENNNTPSILILRP